MLFDLESQVLKQMKLFWNLFFCIALFQCVGCDSFEPFDKSSDAIASRGLESSESLEKLLSREEVSRRLDSGYAKKPELRFLRAPKLRSLELPLMHGMNSIWGATGRDHLGRIYYGVSAWDGLEDPSATLWRFDPRNDSFEFLGSVNEKLDELKLRRRTPFSETQVKIHSKIFQAEDGKIYFSTQDEHQEKEDGSSGALFGGRLFSVDPDSQNWECIHTAPEGLIALAARGRYVVAEGYFGHVIYQYDTQNKTVRSKRLGTFKGHVSRNIFMDRRMHVYAIRVQPAEGDDQQGVYQVEGQRQRVSLVELDTRLEEVQDWPLDDYLLTGTTSSEGITGFCELNDGSIVFVAQTGALWKISMDNDKAKLDRLGWFSSEGPSFCGGLFCPFGDRYVCGFSIKKEGAPYRWTVFDIDRLTSCSLKLDQESQSLMNRENLLAYGTETIDHQARAYVVGWRQLNDGKAPHILQLTWE